MHLATLHGTEKGIATKNNFQLAIKLFKFNLLSHLIDKKSNVIINLAPHQPVFVCAADLSTEIDGFAEKREKNISSK
jgi:hypothetical protein